MRYAFPTSVTSATISSDARQCTQRHPRSRNFSSDSADDGTPTVYENGETSEGVTPTSFLTMSTTNGALTSSWVASTHTVRVCLLSFWSLVHFPFFRFSPCSSLPVVGILSIYSPSPTFALLATPSFVISLSLQLTHGRASHSGFSSTCLLPIQVLSGVLFRNMFGNLALWCPDYNSPSFRLSGHLGEGNMHLPLPLPVLPFFVCIRCCSPSGSIASLLQVPFA